MSAGERIQRGGRANAFDAAVQFDGATRFAEFPIGHSFQALITTGLPGDNQRDEAAHRVAGSSQKSDGRQIFHSAVRRLLYCGNLHQDDSTLRRWTGHMGPLMISRPRRIGEFHLIETSPVGSGNVPARRSIDRIYAHGLGSIEPNSLPNVMELA